MTQIQEWDDYDVCAGNDDGIHGPLVQNYDPEVGDGYCSVACEACGLTTGLPIPPASELVWG